MFSVVDTVRRDVSGSLLEGATSLDSPQFKLRDLVLSVCGTIAVMLTLCMLITFTHCCCLKRKHEDDEEGGKSQGKAKKRNASGAGAETLGAQLQDLNGSETVTQVTIENQAHCDNGLLNDDDEGGFNTETYLTEPSRRKEGMGAVPGRHTNSSNSVSVKDRIKAFETSTSSSDVKLRDGPRPVKKKPKSKAFEEFESQGILIGFGNVPKRKSSEGLEDSEDEDNEDMMERENLASVGFMLPTPPQAGGDAQRPLPHVFADRLRDDDEGIHTMDSEEDEFAAVQRNSEILKSFRRAPPPKNRTKARRSSKRRAQVKDKQQDLFAIHNEVDEEEQVPVAPPPGDKVDSSEPEAPKAQKNLSSKDLQGLVLPETVSKPAPQNCDDQSDYEQVGPPLSNFAYALKQQAVTLSLGFLDQRSTGNSNPEKPTALSDAELTKTCQTAYFSDHEEKQHGLSRTYNVSTSTCSSTCNKQKSCLRDFGLFRKIDHRHRPYMQGMNIANMARQHSTPAVRLPSVQHPDDSPASLRRCHSEHSALHGLNGSYAYTPEHNGLSENGHYDHEAEYGGLTATGSCIPSLRYSHVSL